MIRHPLAFATGEEEVVGDFLQLVISGTAVGAIYALAALGFTLLWQASGTINFAQGEFVMLPAFMTLICLAFGMPLPLAFVVTCLVSMALLGVAFQKAVVEPLIRHGVIPLVIATLGLSIGLKNLVKAGYSAGPSPFPNIFPSTLISLGPLRISAFDIGDVIGLKAFYAAIIGGFNQTRGALLGGVLVGVLENLTGAYLSPAYKEGVALMLFLVVILFKPEGLLGKAEERKV